MNRNALLAMVHIGAKGQFGDDRTAYEDFLEAHTGKRSCKSLSDRQLDKLVAVMRDKGMIKAKPIKSSQTKSSQSRSAGGGKAFDRPTEPQRRKLAALARDMGWQGLDDPALLQFIKRTTRIEAVRFLSRTQMSQVITGLERWRDQERVKYAVPTLQSS